MFISTSRAKPSAEEKQCCSTPTELYYTKGSGTQPLTSSSDWALKQDPAHVKKTKLKLVFKYYPREEFTKWERWHIHYQWLKEGKAQLKTSMSKAEPWCVITAEPGLLSTKQRLCLELLRRGCAQTTLSMESVHGKSTRETSEMALFGLFQ